MKFNRERFLNDLRQLATQNIRWRHQGWRDPAVGFDCIGVFRYAAELQGMVLPKELTDAFESYLRPPNGRRLLVTMRKWLIEIDPDDRQPADLIQCLMNKNPCHTAVDMGDGLIAEAFENLTGVSKFLIWPFPSDRRIATCFRIPDEF
jgi:hypothetical protein